jgi:hypothetical protein
LLSLGGLRPAASSRLSLSLSREVFDLVCIDVEHDLAAASVLILNHQLRFCSVFDLRTSEIGDKNGFPCHELLLLIAKLSFQRLSVRCVIRGGKFKKFDRTVFGLTLLSLTCVRGWG